MKEFYTVGEIAKIYDVSTDTLRFYDKIDLLKPWITGENGYRYYSKAQFETISTVMLLRSMGTPIEELCKAVKGTDPSAMTDVLDKYLGNVDAEIKRLAGLKETAKALHEDITETWQSPEPKLMKLPKMWTFSKPFGSEDELDLDSILKVNRLASKEWLSRAGIISTVKVEDLEAGRFHSYDRYGYLSEMPIDVDSPYLSVLPAGQYVIASACVRTPEHAEMDEAYSGCLKLVKDLGLTVCGDAIERNVLSLYADDPHNPAIYFKIYIPVK